MKQNILHKHFFKLLLLGTCCLLSKSTLSHSINYAMEKAPAAEVVLFYSKLGFEHIIPYGLDHILFIVSLCLLNNRFSTVLWQATAFTVAHSITLALSMKNIFTLPSDIVEPFIALSILFVAIENMILNELKPWRIAIVFLFGLIHGMGFASALNETGLPQNKFLTSIISFNLGVEAGQIAVIALLFALFVVPFGKKDWYKKRIVYPLSIGVALMAAFWTVERLLT